MINITSFNNKGTYKQPNIFGYYGDFGGCGGRGVYGVRVVWDLCGVVFWGGFGGSIGGGYGGRW